MRALVPILLPSMFFAHLVSAATVHVPGDQPSIRAGIESAASGDTVIVSAGTYNEHDIPLKSGITVRSQAGAPECVRIDAQRLGRVFLSVGVDSTTSIEGFTLANGLSHEEYPYGARGGGIYCENSTLRCLDCSFQENTADGGSSWGDGGGVYCWYSSLTLIRCVFFRNSALGNLNGVGGAIYSGHSSPQVAACTFSENHAAGYTGGAGAIDFRHPSSPVVTQCVFLRNTGGVAGALNLHTGVTADVSQCVFAENTGSTGGGISCWGADPPSIRNCTLYGNAAEVGGALYCDFYASPALQNCILAFSAAGGAVYCQDATQPASATLTCCDVYGNAGGDWVDCIAEQFGTDDNISEDPRFCDPANRDLHIDADSPCSPGHQPACGLVGALGVGCGATAIERRTWGSVKSIFQ